MNSDTVKLLRECDAGTKMAVTSIDEVLDKIGDYKLKGLLNESKSHHGELGNKIHNLLSQNEADEKDPNPIAKSMSWVKTNMKMGINDSNTTVADLITDGCNMGIKSLSQYLNQYKAADSISKGICNELIKIEEQLSTDLRSYL